MEYGIWDGLWDMKLKIISLLSLYLLSNLTHLLFQDLTNNKIVLRWDLEIEK